MGKGWYRVNDTNGKEYAIFSLSNAPEVSPVWCKHMDLHFHPHIAEEFIQKGNTRLLLNIYSFVFRSVMKITHELKGVQLCKIYSNDDLTAMVYKGFASRLSGKYDVKFYGRWIEILKKDK